MKAVLISIKPKWCEKIASGEKTIEVRKTKPKLDAPFKCYIYCTSVKTMNLQDYCESHKKTGGEIDDWSGKVIGEFACDKIEVLFNTNGNPANYMKEVLPDILERSRLSFNDFQRYTNSRGSKHSIYGWHISDLEIYDKPRELSEYSYPCNRDCDDCKHQKLELFTRFDEPIYSCEGITRPPQSWCYVEDGEQE